jgi:hypothetical protein
MKRSRIQWLGAVVMAIAGPGPADALGQPGATDIQLAQLHDVLRISEQGKEACPYALREVRNRHNGSGGNTTCSATRNQDGSWTMDVVTERSGFRVHARVKPSGDWELLSLR